jgi:AFG3 family protein
MLYVKSALRIVFYLLCFYYITTKLGIVNLTTEVTYKNISDKINTNHDSFSFIQIDEPNGFMYLYPNSTLLDNNTTFSYSRILKVSISKHIDYESKINELYSSKNKTVPNIIYKTNKSMSAYFFEIMFTMFTLYLLFTLIRKFIMKENLIDHPLVSSSREFTVVAKEKTRFSDVIGLSNVKDDLKEYIGYFKDRQKYIENGCKIPRGLIFSGKPGTGKTLLGKALAGESKVSFIYACGSDFMEVFVGVGSQRVRKLFKLAREFSPAIIFIDEIDSIGKSRSGKHFSHGEQDNTLNSLLAEMDGMKQNENILVIAATNIIGSLDSALTRSGRFDKKVIFDIPNKAERQGMFKLYMNKIKLSPDLVENMDKYTLQLSSMTAGLTGADIENITNHAIMSFMKRIYKVESSEDVKNKSPVKEIEMNNDDGAGVGISAGISASVSAIVSANIGDSIVGASGDTGASVGHKKGTTFKDFENAIADVAVGMVKRERTMTDGEKDIVAHHEAGHAIVAYLLKQCQPPVKVSIIPRGEAALGYSQQEPTDQKLYSKEELFGRMCVLLGGRVAEEETFKKITTGASDDIQKLTKIAYGIVSMYGMSKSIGELNMMDSDNPYKDVISQKTKEKIDAEVHKLVSAAKDTTRRLVDKYHTELKKIASYLLENEEVTKYDLEKIFKDNKIENIVDVSDFMTDVF